MKYLNVIVNCKSCKYKNEIENLAYKIANIDSFDTKTHEAIISGIVSMEEDLLCNELKLVKIAYYMRKRPYELNSLGLLDYSKPLEFRFLEW